MLLFWLIFNSAAVSRYFSNSILLQETNSKDKFLNSNVFENSSSYLDDEDLSKIKSFVIMFSVACNSQKKILFKNKIINNFFQRDRINIIICVIITF